MLTVIDRKDPIYQGRVYRESIDGPILTEEPNEGSRMVVEDRAYDEETGLLKTIRLVGFLRTKSD